MSSDEGMKAEQDNANDSASGNLVSRKHQSSTRREALYGLINRIATRQDRQAAIKKCLRAATYLYFLFETHVYMYCVVVEPRSKAVQQAVSCRQFQKMRYAILYGDSEADHTSLRLNIKVVRIPIDRKY